MLIAVYHKFNQHNDLKNLLLETGDKVLIEHTKNDSYWADGGGNI
jgi:N-glycosidase YbiA